MPEVNRCVLLTWYLKLSGREMFGRLASSLEVNSERMYRAGTYLVLRLTVSSSPHCSVQSAFLSRVNLKSLRDFLACSAAAAKFAFLAPQLLPAAEG